MLKNLKLGKKISGGFAIVLIMMAVVAYIGYNSLSDVTDHVEKADDVNRLVKELLEAREQEKNYIIRGQDEYVTAVEDLIKSV